MLQVSKAIQTAYNNVSVEKQLRAIIDKPKVFNKLRLVQQRYIKLIETSYYKEMRLYLSKEEKEYLFNIYYNFVVKNYQFPDKQEHQPKSEHSPKHIGMRMLSNMAK